MCLPPTKAKIWLCYGFRFFAGISILRRISTKHNVMVPSYEKLVVIKPCKIMCLLIDIAEFSTYF